MMSAAVTAPPGELIRRITAFTAGSPCALSSFSMNSLTGLSLELSRPVWAWFISRPSTSTMAILSVTKKPGSVWMTVSDISSLIGMGLTM